MLSTSILERLKPNIRGLGKHHSRSTYKTLPSVAAEEREGNTNRCTISNLPEEILSYIFVLCLPTVEETRGDMNSSITKRSITGQRPLWISTRRSPINVSHVDRTWRSIALSTAKLWSVLAVQGTTSARGYWAKREFTILNAFIQRSAEAPLDILVDINVPADLVSIDSYMIQCIQLLVAQRPRWRSVHLVYCFCQVGIVSPILQNLVGEGNSTVSELYFCMHSCSVEKDRDITPTFFHPSLPSLTKLTIFSRATRFDLSNCPQLRQLSLTSPMSLKEVRQWLIQCPSLESIACGRVNMYNSLENESTRRNGSFLETLPNLRSLSLYFDVTSDVEFRVSDRAIGTFLGSIILPNLNDLVLSLHSKTTSGKCLNIKPVISLLRISGSPITSLDIHSFAFSTGKDSQEEITDLCQLTERLQQLIINGDTINSILDSKPLTKSGNLKVVCHNHSAIWPELERVVVTNPKESTMRNLSRLTQNSSFLNDLLPSLKRLDIHECGRGSSERRGVRQILLKSPAVTKCRETEIKLTSSTNLVG